MLLEYPLDGILGQLSKVKILRFLISSQAEFNGREIASAIGLSHVACHNALKNLVKHGIVSMRRVGRSHVYTLEFDNVLVKNLLTPLFDCERNITKSMTSLIIEAIGKNNTLSVILFGSSAKGIARPDSDYDVLIIMSDTKALRKTMACIDEIEDKVSEHYGNRLSPVVMTGKTFRERYKKQDSLIKEVAETGKVLYGMSIGEVLGYGRS